MLPVPALGFVIDPRIELTIVRSLRLMVLSLPLPTPAEFPLPFLIPLPTPLSKNLLRFPADGFVIEPRMVVRSVRGVGAEREVVMRQVRTNVREVVVRIL
jgi:hypothetical protein